MSLSFVRLLFAVVGVYDFAIGLAFLVAGPQLFDAFGVPPVNHWGYVQFASLLLIIFGTMFFALAFDPVANRNLMLYGMMLKLGYTALVIYYWVAGDCPLMFKPFAVIDGIMFVLFLLAYAKRRTPA